MVTVKLDKERHLRLTLRGMLRFLEMTGINLIEGVVLSDLGFKEKTCLMYACLIHEDKDLTYDEFSDIIDLSNMNELANAVAQCIVESVPDKDKTDPLVKKRS